MKKQSFFYAILLVVILGCFSACRSIEECSPSIPQDTPVDTQSNTDANPEVESYYNSYYCYGDHPLFDEQVSQNGLDRAYLQETSETQTKADLEGCEQKYIALWKEELEFSIAELRTYLSDEQNSDTAQTILDANQAMESLWRFEYSLRDTEYEGHDLTFHRLYEEKEWYRDMTMRVKYLTFMLSQESDPEYKTTWKHQEIY